VTKVAELPSNTDGMTADRDKNLYMTALELNGLMHRNAETGKVTKYWSDASVSWADTLGWGPDGSLYLVTNHLHLWLDKAMNFDNPMVTNFRIWNIAVHGTPYLEQ
jgi:hypothetical protein